MASIDELIAEKVLAESAENPKCFEASREHLQKKNPDIYDFITEITNASEADRTGLRSKRCLYESLILLYETLEQSNKGLPKVCRTRLEYLDSLFLNQIKGTNFFLSKTPLRKTLNLFEKRAIRIFYTGMGTSRETANTAGALIIDLAYYSSLIYNALMQPKVY